MTWVFTRRVLDMRWSTTLVIKEKIEPMEGLTYTALLLVFAGTHGLALKQFA